MTSARLAAGRMPTSEYPRGRFTDKIYTRQSEVQRVLQVIDDAGVADQLHLWRTEDRAAQGIRGGGRRPFATDRQVLGLFLLLSVHRQPPTITAMTALLAWGLDEDCRTLLGLDPVDARPNEVYDRLQHSIHRTLAVIDPHVYSKKEKLTKMALEEVIASWDESVVEERKQRVRWVMNAIVHGSFLQLPAKFRDRWRGNCCVDGTAIPAYGSRGTLNSSDYAGIEPFAGAYVRRGVHGHDPKVLAKLSRADFKKLGAIMHAWEASIIVTGTNDPKRETTFPMLAVGINVHQPSVDPGLRAVEGLGMMRANGLPAGIVAGDRAYGSSPRPEKYALPVRALGYQIICDMKEDQLGKVHFVDGAVLLEGSVYCPAIMKYPSLVTATRDYRLGDPETQETISTNTWIARIDARAKFLAPTNGKPRTDGSCRFRCPATGPNPTLTCPLRPELTKTAEAGPYPLRSSDTEGFAPGPICTNAGGNMTATPTDIFPRYYQDMQFGSEDWALLYTSMRQSVESFNHKLKSGVGGSARNSDERRIRGLAANSLLIACLIAAVNMHTIERWMAKPVEVDGRGRGPTLKKIPRRRDMSWGRERTGWTNNAQRNK